MSWSPLFIGAVESHRFLVDLSMKELSCYNGVPLQGPQYAVVSHDAHTELESTVRHLFVNITSSTTVSRQVYASLQKLLHKQDLGHASLFTFQRTVSYSRGAMSNHRVLTVYPLKIVSQGEGTSIVERTPALQTDQTYAILRSLAPAPAEQKVRSAVGTSGAGCSNGGPSALRTLFCGAKPLCRERSIATMSLINMAKREITCKIVYYGIGLCGKTTNLHYIYRTVRPQDVGEMVSVDTQLEGTLYFDLLPLELGDVHGLTIRFQLYTVPGQTLYQHTRFSVLKGADCVIFVADSQASKLHDNIQSWNELQEQLQRMRKQVSVFPLVMQWNKRDLADSLSLSVLQKYLNPYRVPSVESVAVAGQGVIESLRIGINRTLHTLPVP
jgi:signal recognition particle receptor subunit beta